MWRLLCLVSNSLYTYWYCQEIFRVPGGRQTSRRQTKIISDIVSGDSEWLLSSVVRPIRNIFPFRGTIPTIRCMLGFVDLHLNVFIQPALFIRNPNKYTYVDCPFDAWLASRWKQARKQEQMGLFRCDQPYLACLVWCMRPLRFVSCFLSHTGGRLSDLSNMRCLTNLVIYRGDRSKACEQMCWRDTCHVRFIHLTLFCVVLSFWLVARNK